MHKAITPILLSALFGILFMPGCAGEDSTEQQPLTVSNRFDDPVLQRIHDLQDERRQDSLHLYLSDANPLYRKEAAIGLANIQEIAMIPLLEDVLKDEEPGVAAAAAYAIGQTGDKSGTLPLRQRLEFPDSIWSLDNGFLYSRILEALGRCAQEIDLDYIIFKHEELTVPHTDEALMTGIFRFAAMGITSPKAQRTAAQALDSEEQPAAMMAAHSLARLPKADSSIIVEEVLPRLPKIKDPLVRMATVRALRHLPKSINDSILLPIALDEQEDPLTRVNALYSWEPKVDEGFLDRVLPLLQCENTQVAVAASSILRAKAKGVSHSAVKDLASEISNLRVQAELYRWALKEAMAAEDDEAASEISSLIKSTYEGSKDRYQKRQLLAALAESANNYDFLSSQVLGDAEPTLQSGAMEAVATMFDRDSLQFKPEDQLEFLKQTLLKKDPAAMAIAADVIRVNAKKYRPFAENTDFLTKAMEGLDLPTEIETYIGLQRAQWELEEATRRIRYRQEYNHPIDWELVSRVDKEATAVLKTSKGDITFALLIDEAPATVVNFIELVQDDYFDGKFFHRVVPNFVAQAGCPRGDGYGGYPTTVRSEWPDLRYETGSVGMASAGKDTEGSQIFITHSPTPHLDGRYSIFAKVSEGMDVVQLLEVGDQIQDVVLQGVASKEN